MAINNNEQLINNIIGQLNGINKMIDNKKDCFSIIIQLKAVKSATNNLMNKYIEESFKSCVDGCQSPEKVKKLIKELTINN